MKDAESSSVGRTKKFLINIDFTIRHPEFISGPIQKILFNFFFANLNFVCTFAIEVQCLKKPLYFFW